MPSEVEALDKLVKELEADFKKEKVLTAKLRKEIIKNFGPKKYYQPMLDLAKKMEDTRHEITSQEQTISRLERQIEILQKEIGAVKRDALTEADIKPFKQLLK